MSTQLILYPQSFKGSFGSTITPTPANSQFLVNGSSFLNLSTTTLHNTNAGIPSQDAINNSPPTILGKWYRFTTTGSPWGAVTAPTNTNNNLVLSYNATAGHTGVYQQLSQMSTTGQYDIVITIATPVVGTITIKIFDGTIQTVSAPITSNLNTITFTFTSPSTNPTFLIDYTSTVGNLTLEDISIQPNQVSPPQTFTNLQSGEVICDLYEEEAIPLTLSVDDFKNAAEQVKSYSKDFDLPATKRNNKIFDNIFEVTRADDGLVFNPLKQTRAALKQDGFLLFEGYLRLINIKDQEGEISYNVNLFSQVIALADRLQDLTFDNIDFTELNHAYNRTNIISSADTDGLALTNPLPVGTFAGTAGASVTDVLKYPFIDWDHQFLVGGTGSGTGATSGNPELIKLETAFRPCIKIKYLIDKIFANSGFNYTSDFFNTTEFSKLFMDFNWGAGGSPSGVVDNTGVGAIDYPAHLTLSTAAFALIPFNANSYPAGLGYLASGSTDFRASTDNQLYDITYGFQYDVASSSGAWSFDLEWRHFDTSAGTTTVINHQTITGSGNVFSALVAEVSFNIFLDTNDTIGVYAKNTTATSPPTIRFLGTSTIIAGANTIVSTWSNIFVSSEILKTKRGLIKQFDFLKGILKMFNLVTLADDNNPDNILIEPYSDVFIDNGSGSSLASRSIQHDWTGKIDVSQIELKPLDLKRTTIFKFVEDEDDYPTMVYKNATSGRLYGSLTWSASNFDILDGEEEIIADPFGATLVKPLADIYPDLIIPCIYSMNDAGETESFENSPRILYNNGKVTLSNPSTYFLPAQNGVAESNVNLYLRFSHLSDVPTALGTNDYYFTSQQIPSALGFSPANNLFSIYWQPYYSELYHPDTRTMTLKVNLNASDINTFKFTDKVFIKNRVFRINKIEYKPNTLSIVEFILIG
tara:strand:+ start:5872 stop:8646 length:2775 start_codon:yes stop_codon:yes gene_type:complete